MAITFELTDTNLILEGEVNLELITNVDVRELVKDIKSVNASLIDKISTFVGFDSAGNYDATKQNLDKLTFNIMFRLPFTLQNGSYPYIQYYGDPLSETPNVPAYGVQVPQSTKSWSFRANQLRTKLNNNNSDIDKLNSAGEEVDTTNIQKNDYTTDEGYKHLGIIIPNDSPLRTYGLFSPEVSGSTIETNYNKLNAFTYLIAQNENTYPSIWKNYRVPHTPFPKNLPFKTYSILINEVSTSDQVITLYLKPNGNKKTLVDDLKDKIDYLDSVTVQDVPVVTAANDVNVKISIDTTNDKIIINRPGSGSWGGGANDSSTVKIILVKYIKRDVDISPTPSADLTSKVIQQDTSNNSYYVLEDEKDPNSKRTITTVIADGNNLKDLALKKHSNQYYVNLSEYEGAVFDENASGITYGMGLDSGARYPNAPAFKDTFSIKKIGNPSGNFDLYYENYKISVPYNSNEIEFETLLKTVDDIRFLIDKNALSVTSNTNGWDIDIRNKFFSYKSVVIYSFMVMNNPNIEITTSYSLITYQSNAGFLKNFSEFENIMNKTFFGFGTDGKDWKNTLNLSSLRIDLVKRGFSLQAFAAYKLLKDKKSDFNQVKIPLENWLKHVRAIQSIIINSVEYNSIISAFTNKLKGVPNEVEKYIIYSAIYNAGNYKEKIDGNYTKINDAKGDKLKILVAVNSHDRNLLKSTLADVKLFGGKKTILIDFLNTDAIKKIYRDV